MITSTAQGELNENNLLPSNGWLWKARQRLGLRQLSAAFAGMAGRMSSTRFPARLLFVCLWATALCKTQATTVLGPWVPLFKAVDWAVGTNTPDGTSLPHLQVVNALRVDLTDPDVRMFATPRTTNYVLNLYETGGLTTTNFLTTYTPQLVINANNFHDPNTLDSPSYTLPQWTKFVVTGELMTTGQVVSVQESATDAGTFMFTASNQPTFIPTNWPPASTAGQYTIVSGLYAVLVNGVNIAYPYTNSVDFVHQVNPRTGFGLSKDRRYLYMLTIDGRQSGYSDGAWDWETADWLALVGAWDGANMDGGGSTCLAIRDTTGHVVELNHDSASASYRVERTIGCHLGFFLKPVPAFINDVSALPDDTAATVTWTTLSPATTQVQYGPTTNLGFSTLLYSALVTNHAALLTGLAPGTGYYFKVLSSTGGNPYVSSNFFLITSNYAVTNAMFDLTNTWQYDTTNLDGINWTSPSYDDSAWDGSGPGVLWVDNRGPNAAIYVPLNTEMPLDPASGYPFRTYYLRTHFTFTNNLSGVSLLFQDFIDDGAVFYLNGTEIYRLRMAAAPALIQNSTLAIGYPCSGDATCPDNWAVTGPLTTNLVNGDNVLAAEVHNYNALSPDITFGLSLAITLPYVSNPPLGITVSNDTANLSWTRGGFTLQQANSLAGPWTDVPGPIVSSPYVTGFSNLATYFRLKK